MCVCTRVCTPDMWHVHMADTYVMCIHICIYKGYIYISQAYIYMYTCIYICMYICVQIMCLAPNGVELLRI
jgi:hypothetical protein